MNLTVRPATQDDARIISSIMVEAADWQKRNGHPAWHFDSISMEAVVREINLFFLAEIDAEASGSFKFQTEDKLFWPDHPGDEAAYLHKIAVRRKFAGGKISHSILVRAAEHARTLRKIYLRLDCDAASPSLRGVYENFGFVYHSDKSMGSFVVARYQYEI
jgi:hypothetical protein